MKRHELIAAIEAAGDPIDTFLTTLPEAVAWLEGLNGQPLAAVQGKDVVLWQVESLMMPGTAKPLVFTKLRIERSAMTQAQVARGEEDAWL